MSENYLFDTHALILWSLKQGVTDEFISFFDRQTVIGNVMVSSISFWETALLSKKGRIEISDVHEWKSGLLRNSGIRITEPDASDMIDSVLLPDHHKDPFDRLLIVQANRCNAVLVSKDRMFELYDVRTVWI